MNRGSNPAKHIAPNVVRFQAAFLGGGAATNCTVPSDGVLTSTSGTFPKQMNLGSTLTYSSTGVYVGVLSETFRHLVPIGAVVVASGNSPTAVLCCEVTKVDPTTGFTVKVTTPSGTLTDLGTSDMVVLTFDGADTTAF
jgi:hypothetical protein